MLTFRNIDITPDQPVDEWGVEGILTALEMGDVEHWGKIVASARKSQHVRDNLNQAIECAKGGFLADDIVNIIERMV